MRSSRNEGHKQTITLKIDDYIGGLRKRLFHRDSLVLSYEDIYCERGDEEDRSD